MGGVAPKSVMESRVVTVTILHHPIAEIFTTHEQDDMVLVLRRVVLLHALFSAWCAAQQRTGDGRVILNLGYFASYGGNFVSSGEGTCRHVIVGRDI